MANLVFSVVPFLPIDSTRPLQPDDFTFIYYGGNRGIDLNSNLGYYWSSTVDPGKWVRDQDEVLLLQRSVCRAVSDLWNFYLSNEVSVIYDLDKKRGVYGYERGAGPNRYDHADFYNVEVNVRYPADSCILDPCKCDQGEPTRTKQRLCVLVNALVESDRADVAEALKASTGQERHGVCKVVSEALTSTTLLGDATIPAGVFLRQRQAILVF